MYVPFHTVTKTCMIETALLSFYRKKTQLASGFLDRIMFFAVHGMFALYNYEARISTLTTVGENDTNYKAQGVTISLQKMVLGQ